MDNYTQALSWAQNYCSKAEHCAADVLKKLEKYQLDTRATTGLMEELCKGDFLNEARYARAYAMDQFRFSRWGKIKICYVLRQKNISEAVIEEALEQIPAREYIDVLAALLSNKEKQYTDLSVYEKRAKLLRFAYSKGFEPDYVNQWLDSSKDY